MKAIITPAFATAVLGFAGLASGQEPPNPNVRFQEFTEVSAEVQKLRTERLLTEDQFLKLAAEPGTVVLDARSKDKYEQLHVKGAVSLPYTDFTAEALAKVIPEKSARVLIYCNNNFKDEQRAFPGKHRVALNIPTFITLHSYGYTNVHELQPLLEVKNAKLTFAGTMVDPGPLEAQPGERKWPPDTKDSQLSFVNVIRAKDGTISPQPPAKPDEFAIVGAPAFETLSVRKHSDRSWIVSGKIVSTNAGGPRQQVKIYTGRGARLEQLVAMSDHNGEILFALSPQTSPEGKESLPEYLYLDKHSSGWVSGPPEAVERPGWDFRRYQLNYP